VPRRTEDARGCHGRPWLDFDGDRYEKTEAAQTYPTGQTADDLRPLLIARDQLSWPGETSAQALRPSQSDKRHGQPSEEEPRICSDATDALAPGAYFGDVERPFRLMPNARFG